MYINIGLSFDLDYLETTNCEGVGLYRTEIPFMSASQCQVLTNSLCFIKSLWTGEWGTEKQPLEVWIIAK